MYDVYNTFYNDIKIWSFALRIFFMHILLLRILTTRYSSKIRNNNQHWEFWLVVLIMIGWSDSIYRSKSDRIESQSAGTRVTAISLRIRARIELVRAWRPNLAWISRDWMSKSELHNAWEERDFLVETRNEGNTRKKDSSSNFSSYREFDIEDCPRNREELWSLEWNLWTITWQCWINIWATYLLTFLLIGRSSVRRTQES